MRTAWARAAGSVAWVLLAVLAGLVLGACDRGPGPDEAPVRGRGERGTSSARGPGADPASGPARDPAQTVELVFPYGSEKKAWLEEATAAFNASGVTTASGKAVVVRPVPMGSGESIDEVLAGRLEAHLISPASAAFITLGNARSQAATGGPLLGPTQDLVLSPVVIAMWKPMAEALGWGREAIGWAEILALTQHPDGWGSRGFPQWGRFRFGHTHPEYSNSGLMAVLAQAYAGAGKVADLTVEDAASERVASELAAIQRAVVHYGDSTGFFAKRMLTGGPGYLSAAVLYENLVIESYGQPSPGGFPLVAVYPKEGAFWSEHPVGIVRRPWVTPEHAEGAEAYIRFLLAPEQQRAAMRHGFRPSDVSIPLGAPFDAAHGVDPREPRTVLATPGAPVIDRVIEAWRANKKTSHVVLALDVSGSMDNDGKIAAAREGAREFVSMLADEDVLSVLVFNSQVRWLVQNAALGTERARVQAQLASLIANGGTALYDGVAAAVAHIESAADSERITSVVVLSDGADRNSRRSLDALLTALAPDDEARRVRVFTIGYGADAAGDVLQKISDRTQAKYVPSGTGDIRKVFKEIATFF